MLPLLKRGFILNMAFEPCATRVNSLLQDHAHSPRPFIPLYPVSPNRTISQVNMNTAPRSLSEAWRLQILKLLQADPSLSQRQLAVQLGVSLGKANYCVRALVEKGLVKLGNFSKNQSKCQYIYLLTPAGLEEKTRITLAFLKRKEAEFEAIQREIEALKGELESCDAECQPATQSNNPSPGTKS